MLSSLAQFTGAQGFTRSSQENCANCTRASVGRATHPGDPVLCPSASRPRQPLDAASRCDLPLHCVICHDGFSHNAFFSSVSGAGWGGAHNVLLWQPNMLPARLGAARTLLLLSEFPGLKLSVPSHYPLPPPLPFSDLGSSAKCFLQANAFIWQENLDLQTLFVSSLIHLFVLNVLTREITI